MIDLASKYEVDAETGCWNWTRAKTSAGYGEVWDRSAKRVLLAHRVSHEQSRGPIPEGLVIDHLCRNLICVNPDHLEAVPQSVNISRSRQGRLTEDDVRSIRDQRGKKTQRQLAVEFGVSHTTIKDIQLGRMWRHVV